MTKEKLSVQLNYLWNQRGFNPAFLAFVQEHSDTYIKPIVANSSSTKIDEGAINSQCCAHIGKECYNDAVKDFYNTVILNNGLGILGRYDTHEADCKMILRAQVDISVDNKYKLPSAPEIKIPPNFTPRLPNFNSYDPKHHDPNVFPF